MIRTVFSFPLRIFLSIFLSALFAGEAQAMTPSTPAVTLGTESLRKLPPTDSSHRSANAAMPLENVRITSKFGPRKHPVLNKAAFHGGVDMRARLNDKVKSISDGIVTFSGPRGALGNAVFISHPKLKATSIYGHLNRVSVSKGKKVKAGAVIGYAGTTGRSTGVHLHLTVKDQKTGKSVEPISFLASIEKKTGTAKTSIVATRESALSNTLLASTPEAGSRTSVARKTQLAIAKDQNLSQTFRDKQEKLTLRAAQTSRQPILFASTGPEAVRQRISASSEKRRAVLATVISNPSRGKWSAKYLQVSTANRARKQHTRLAFVQVKPASINSTASLYKQNRSVVRLAQTRKIPTAIKLASSGQVKKLRTKTILTIQKAPATIVVASRPQLAITKAKAIPSQQPPIPRKSDIAKVAGLRSAIAQAVASAQSLQSLYSEGIIARKQYLAAEQRVSQLREELRDAQSKS